jgi:uncharacterized Fe-S radical SAM superfamily protein PflX
MYLVTIISWFVLAYKIERYDIIIKKQNEIKEDLSQEEYQELIESQEEYGLGNSHKNPKLKISA